MNKEAEFHKRIKFFISKKRQGYVMQAWREVEAMQPVLDLTVEKANEQLIEPMNASHGYEEIINDDEIILEGCYSKADLKACLAIMERVENE